MCILKILSSIFAFFLDLSHPRPPDQITIFFITIIIMKHCLVAQVKKCSCCQCHLPDFQILAKGWGLSAKLGKHSAIWGKLGTPLQAYTLNPCAKFPPNPTSRKVNT